MVTSGNQAETEKTNFNMEHRKKSVSSTQLGVRFLCFYFTGRGSGHVQSLMLCAVLLNLGSMLFVLGVLADPAGFNRRLLERILVRYRKLGQLVDDHAGPADRSTPQ